MDIQSVTEASLRVMTCSGALKLGKIKASSVDIDTDGESKDLAKSLVPATPMSIAAVACMQAVAPAEICSCITTVPISCYPVYKQHVCSRPSQYMTQLT